MNSISRKIKYINLGLALCGSFMISLVFITSCKKDNPPLAPEDFHIKRIYVNDQTGTYNYYNTSLSFDCRVILSAPVDTSSAKKSIIFSTKSGITLPLAISFENKDSIIHFQTLSPLNSLSRYNLSIKTALTSKRGNSLVSEGKVKIITQIDSTDKFPRISDDQLLTKIQQQTFKYFYDFAHPSCGMARERNISGDVVTTGGSGFGVMALIVGIERGFITRNQGIARLDKILTFLATCDRFHGAWPHWLNGNTGKTVPFTQYDDGGDLVETSYMVQGLITMRQYLNSGDATENALISRINALCSAVEYDWFRNGGQNSLFWHWSPTYGWQMNFRIEGYNETLITYVVAATSTTHPITKEVYQQGYAKSGAIVNGNTYYNIKLPIGEPYGGPLFFSQYSYLGLDPRNLSDIYANYWEQNVNHSLINFTYCKTNPKNYMGYSKNCWGLTATDNPWGYAAHSPSNDLGVISPTAAVSAIAYTPTQSMNAIRFFYYTLGDKVWGDYGFYDSFDLNEAWWSSAYLSIDQGPEICMIENYRTALLWNLFMSASEVKAGLTKLGFSY
ncbi:MAG: beta-glucosidase [Bacteroidales bacterium]|nr:beta-glucosidase [Bacteroidales bacterium]